MLTVPILVVNTSKLEAKLSLWQLMLKDDPGKTTADSYYNFFMFCPDFSEATLIISDLATYSKISLIPGKSWKISTIENFGPKNYLMFPTQF